MAGVVLASDWCQKTFVFSAQSWSSKTQRGFAYIHPGQLLAMCLLKEESSNHSTKCRRNHLEFFKKLTANMLDLLQVS